MNVKLFLNIRKASQLLLVSFFLAAPFGCLFSTESEPRAPIRLWNMHSYLFSRMCWNKKNIQIFSQTFVTNEMRKNSFPHFFVHTINLMQSLCLPKIWTFKGDILTLLSTSIYVWGCSRFIQFLHSFFNPDCGMRNFNERTYQNLSNCVSTEQWQLGHLKVTVVTCATWMRSLWMSSSKESRFPNCIYFLPCRIKEHVDLLWEEFNIPIWVTEFN